MYSSTILNLGGGGGGGGGVQVRCVYVGGGWGAIFFIILYIKTSA